MLLSDLEIGVPVKPIYVAFGSAFLILLAAPILISPVHALCHLLDDIKTGIFLFLSFFSSLFSVILKLVFFVWFIFIFQV